MKKRYEVTWYEIREVKFREQVWAESEAEAIELSDADTAEELSSNLLRAAHTWQSERIEEE